jgi:hypothetical protein
MHARKITERSLAGKLPCTIEQSMFGPRVFLAIMWSMTVAFLASPSCTPESNIEEDHAVAPTVLERVGYLPRELRESSGVAVSRRHDGVIWSHNDSGHEARLYALNLQGELLGIFRATNTENVDWEDIALGPCLGASTDCLYIADTGDNLYRRSSVSIYVIPEPDLPPDAVGLRDTEVAQRFEVRYAEGPQDVEAMAVGPGGEVLLVSRARGKPMVKFVISRDQLLAGSEITLQPTNDTGLQLLRTLGRWVSGAAVSPSGSRVVLRTFTELFFYTYDGRGSLAPIGEPCVIGAREPQGEGVDFLDEDTVVLTSEALTGRPGPITLVTCPT